MGRIGLVPLFLLGWFYYLLPRPLRMALGGATGFVLTKLKLREKVVRQNLAFAFPDSPKIREEIFRASYSHLGNLIFEILMLFGPMRRFVVREVTIDGGGNWKKAHEQGRGVIFLSSHVGNWEIMAAGGGVQLGIDLMLVTKHLKPEWLHRAVERGRRKCGVRGTYEPRTMRDVLAHLKRGGTVGMVLDQYAGPPVGVRVPVFGIPVGTMSAAAMLAKRTGVPVLPVVNYRDRGGRHRIEIRPPVAWRETGSADEIPENTAFYASILERDIFAHPDQWLWTHRRFKGDLSPLRQEEWLEARARK